jgi:hypothetical protein
VTLHMKRAWRNGTSSMVFSPAELVARLAALVPPRKNTVLYCGVLAPNAAWRASADSGDAWTARWGDSAAPVIRRDCRVPANVDVGFKCIGH